MMSTSPISLKSNLIIYYINKLCQFKKFSYLLQFLTILFDKHIDKGFAHKTITSQMFKKRNANNKKASTDLGQQLEQIRHTEPMEEVKTDRVIPQEGKKDKIGGNRNRGIRSLQEEVQQEQRRSRIDNKQPNEDKFHRTELQECFNQFKEHHKVEIEEERAQRKKNMYANNENEEDIYGYQRNQQPMGQKPEYNLSRLRPTNSNPFQHQDDDDTFNPFHHHQQEQAQQQSQQPPPKLFTQQVVLQDNSAQLLEIQQNYGQISPSQDPSQDDQQCYQNQIIRKTLTRQNYLKINTNLKQAHQKSRKDKILKELGKITHSSVQRKIAMDLKVKTSRRDELKNQISYIENKIQKRMREISTKLQAKAALQSQFDKVRRVLQLIYYYGDQLEKYDEDYIRGLSQSMEYMGKISRLRTHMKKKREGFRQKAENKDGRSQDQGKGKGKGKGDRWNGFEEQGMMEEGDDDCIILD